MTNEDAVRRISQYVSKTPTKVPPGSILVHNTMRSSRVRMGTRGFRAWFDAPEPKEYRVVLCRCSWAPHLPRHFRVDPAMIAAIYARPGRRR